MEKVKIKRAKKNNKTITTKEKILAGIGLGSTLLGGAGAVAPKPSQTQFVRSEEAGKTQSGTSRAKEALRRIFGIPSAKAAEVEPGAAQETPGTPEDQLRAKVATGQASQAETEAYVRYLQSQSISSATNGPQKGVDDAGNAYTYDVQPGGQTTITAGGQTVTFNQGSNQNIQNWVNQNPGSQAASAVKDFQKDKLPNTSAPLQYFDADSSTPRVKPATPSTSPSPFSTNAPAAPTRQTNAPAPTQPTAPVNRELNTGGRSIQLVGQPTLYNTNEPDGIQIVQLSVGGNQSEYAVSPDGTIWDSNGNEVDVSQITQAERDSIVASLFHGQVNTPQTQTPPATPSGPSVGQTRVGSQGYTEVFTSSGWQPAEGSIRASGSTSQVFRNGRWADSGTPDAMGVTPAAGATMTIDGVQWRVVGGAWTRAQNAASASVQQNGGANLQVNGNTESGPQAGQSWTLTLSGPDGDVYAVGGQGGRQDRQKIGTIVNGRLVLTGTFSQNDVGSWQQRYVVVQNNQDVEIGRANFNIAPAQAATGANLADQLKNHFHTVGYLKLDDGNGNYLTNPAVYAAPGAAGQNSYGLDYEGAQMVLNWMRANGYANANIVEQKRDGKATRPIYYISVPDSGEFLAGEIARHIISSGENWSLQSIRAETRKGSGTPASEFQAVTPGTGGLLQVGANMDVYGPGSSGTVKVGQGQAAFEQYAGSTVRGTATGANAVGSGSGAGRTGSGGSQNTGARTFTGTAADNTGGAGAGSNWSNGNRTTDTGAGSGGTGGTGAGGSTNTGTSNAAYQAQIDSLTAQVTQLTAQINSGTASAATIQSLNNQIASLNNQIYQLQNNRSGGGGGGGAAPVQSGGLRYEDLVRAQGGNAPAGLQYSDLVRAQGGGVQMPQNYSQPTVAGAATKQYVVKKGDTLWSIAKKQYGDGKRWRDILAANPQALSVKGDVKTLKVGATLAIP